MNIHIVTDSASDLTKEEISDLNVEIVPLSIRFGEEELIDQIELGTEEFYERMKASSDVPQTAAPSPGAFQETFQKCFDSGADTVICINLSGDVSATIQAAETGSKNFNNKDIRIIDSRSVTGGLGTMVLAAGQAAKNGFSVDEIIKEVEDLKQKTRVYAALDTLENLKKGGRIGNAQALLGSMLSIKPIIDFSSGKVEEASKQRTRKKSLLWMRDKLSENGNQVKNLSVMHAQAGDIEDFLELLSSTIDTSTARIGSLGPVVASHAGPGVIGMCFTLDD